MRFGVKVQEIEVVHDQISYSLSCYFYYNFTPVQAAESYLFFLFSVFQSLLTIFYLEKTVRFDEKLQGTIDVDNYIFCNFVFFVQFSTNCPLIIFY